MKVFGKICFWMVLCLALLSANLAGAVNTIRFATVAPEGTSWLQAIKSLAKEVEQKTGGEVKFKIYSSSKMGDELDALRKMRSGQLHAGAFSGMGLGEVQPEIRVMELPFFFENKEEIDYVNEKMYNTFTKQFEQKDMILAGISEAGLVHMFTQKPIHNRGDMDGTKVWVWEGDPLAKEFFEVAEIVPVPLPVTEVVTALQTGMVNSVYVPPQGLIAFQWWPKVNYMMSTPLTNATGGIIFTKKKWQTLTPAQQKIIKEVSRRTGKKLTAISRADNEKAVETFKKNNIQVVDLDPAGKKELFGMGTVVRKNLTGKLFSPGTLQQVEKYVQEYRNQKKPS